MDPIISMKEITKEFPGVFANQNVNFDVFKGEIHALVGENGAGKSTLMSILYGLYQPDKGEIFIKGEKINLTSPDIAIKMGIGMVFQHFMLVPPLTVTENVILGLEPKKGFFIDMAKAIQDVKQISEKYGLIVDPYAKIESVSLGVQQRVEIIKTLYRNAEILIFDEPTAVLTPQEVKDLFSTLRSLKAQGKTIIIITHKLKEVKEISDRVTVLRNGKVIGNVQTVDTTEKELAKMMVGRDVLMEVNKTPAKPGEVIVEINDLCCTSKSDKNSLGLKDINLQIKKGEIIGIAGVNGNGQSELLEVLTGLRKASKGKISVNGEEITNLSSRQIKNHKVAHTHEDRHERGLILDYSVEKNLVLGYHYKKPFAYWGSINDAQVRKHADDMISKFKIKTPDKSTKVRFLSGGNQQKLIIAREFYTDPDFLIISQPTRGVDIGAIEFIYQKVLELRDEGKAILLISAELSEIMSLSDRIAVIYEGEILGIVNSEHTTEEELGLMMAGIRRNGSQTLG